MLISVYVSESNRQAEKRREGVWYYLVQLPEGHVRTKGRSMSFGIVFRQTCRCARDKRCSSHDRQAWRRCWATLAVEELREFGSVVVGTPERVREHLWSIVQEAHVGSLLIQFHMGNMPDDLVRKSMRLFAEEARQVAARAIRGVIREGVSAGAAGRRMNGHFVTVASGRQAQIAELGSGTPVLYLHDVIDVQGSSRDWFPVHHALAEKTKLVALAHAGCADR